MAIVCNSIEDAKAMRDFHDCRVSGKEFNQALSNLAIGVVTSEDVIERTLQLDIMDEKDLRRSKAGFEEKKKYSDVLAITIPDSDKKTQ